MNLLLPRFSLPTIYKSFVRTHLYYGDVIYDQPSNSCLSDKIESVQYNAALDKIESVQYNAALDKIESVQYNAALAITGALRETSKKKLYQKLEHESLKDRRLLRRISYLYKIISTKLPPYLYELIPPLQRSH